MRRFALIIFVSLLSLPTVAVADDDPLSFFQKNLNGGIQTLILRTAELMPEEQYGFKPADDVRTFGQLVAHIAESQYFFCASVRGEKTPAIRVEQTATKAERIEALKTGFAYCNAAYAGLDDASASEPVAFMGKDSPKLGVLSVNSVHTALHYGNLIVYLRMNGIVPPSSDPELMKSLRK